MEAFLNVFLLSQSWGLLKITEKKKYALLPYLLLVVSLHLTSERGYSLRQGLCISSNL